jgi:hypothetical protein
MPTKFDKLVEQSQQMATSITPQEFLIQRSIEQIDQTAKQLAVKTSRSAGDVSRNKASVLPFFTSIFFVFFFFCNQLNFGGILLYFTSSSFFCFSLQFVFIGWKRIRC